MDGWMGLHWIIASLTNITAVRTGTELPNLPPMALEGG